MRIERTGTVTCLDQGRGVIERSGFVACVGVRSRGSWIRVRRRGSCTLVISFIVSYIAFSASHLAFSVSIELTLNVKGNVEVRGKGMWKGKENYEG